MPASATQGGHNK